MRFWERAGGWQNGVVLAEVWLLYLVSAPCLFVLTFYNTCWIAKPLMLRVQSGLLWVSDLSLEAFNFLGFKVTQEERLRTAAHLCDVGQSTRTNRRQRCQALLLSSVTLWAKMRGQCLLAKSASKCPFLYGGLKKGLWNIGAQKHLVSS